ncbi:MAG: NUDIX hydrolase [Gammaproteobacteria bacterium]|nr:NUDIX hydrolase [Gammaproteobacteria bacterium]MDH5170963.1 NUDIX hydrolase [Gammaproteobacteria bacterium]
MLFIDRVYQLAFYVAYRLHLVWNFVFRPQCHGVWVAVWSQGQLLLIKNAYRSSITLPGGSIDGLERPVEAALRELREEVGIEAEPGDLVFWGQYLSLVEYKYDHINLFELELPAMPGFQLDNREVSWAAPSLPEQALALNLFPALRIYLQDKREGNRPGRKNIAPGGSKATPG